MGKKGFFTIYAVDFDGTLSMGRWPELGKPNMPLFNQLIKEKENGAKIILWTCRTGELLDKAVNYCRINGLEFDAVNENIPEIIELYGESGKKITATYYIDDRAITPVDFVLNMSQEEV